MLFDNTIHSFEDSQKIAMRRLPWMVFDYIDGAAGTEYGEKLNRSIMRDLRLQSRVLTNVEHRSIATNLFGKKTDLPFGIAPMGMCNLVSPHGDTFLAELAAKYSIPVGVSTVASTSLETMIETSKGNAWFQLYVSGSLNGSTRLLDRASVAGYETLVLTVDVPEVGRRPRELRRGFKMPFKIGPKQFVDFACHPRWSLSQLVNGKPSMANFGGAFGEFDRTSSRAGANWDFFEKVRNCWKGNLVVKGVLSVEDAVKLKSMGADAIQVSSHGGRQLDSAPPAILALRNIRNAVGPEFPLFYDSGIRSGEDIVKAYAMGASFVFIGRPFLFAIAAGMAKGLDEMTACLADETSITLAQLGLKNIEAATHGVLASTVNSTSTFI